MEAKATSFTEITLIYCFFTLKLTVILTYIKLILYNDKQHLLYINVKEIVFSFQIYMNILIISGILEEFCKEIKGTPKYTISFFYQFT